MCLSSTRPVTPFDKNTKAARNEKSEVTESKNFTKSYIISEKNVNLVSDGPSSPGLSMKDLKVNSNQDGQITRKKLTMSSTENLLPANYNMYLDQHTKECVQSMMQEFAQEFEQKIQVRLNALEIKNYEVLRKTSEDLKLLDMQISEKLRNQKEYMMRHFRAKASD